LPSDQGASKCFIDLDSTVSAGQWRDQQAFLTGSVGDRMREVIVEAGPRDPEPSVGRLARLLVEFERTLSADPPDRVVLADDSDEALAAALVAAKLPIAIEARATARAPGSPNGRLIAQLARP
jgi:hypothetical protein